MAFWKQRYFLLWQYALRVAYWSIVVHRRYCLAKVLSNNLVDARYSSGSYLSSQAMFAIFCFYCKWGLCHGCELLQAPKS